MNNKYSFPKVFIAIGFVLSLSACTNFGEGMSAVIAAADTVMTTVGSSSTKGSPADGSSTKTPAAKGSTQSPQGILLPSGAPSANEKAAYLLAKKTK